MTKGVPLVKELLYYHFLGYVVVSPFIVEILMSNQGFNVWMYE